jgi:hypothetical protein
MKILIISIVLLLLSFKFSSKECVCEKKSVEKHFCDSVFVIKINITSDKQISDQESYDWYDFELLKFYKSNSKAHEALETSKIWVPNNSSDCKRNFILGETYIISGCIDSDVTKAMTDLCRFGRQINHLDRRENRFFRILFKKHKCIH